MRPVGTRTLVLVERRRDAFGARAVGASAGELPAGGIEAPGARGESLVELAEQRLDASDSYPGRVHIASRLRCRACRTDDGRPRLRSYRAAGVAAAGRGSRRSVP